VRPRTCAAEHMCDLDGRGGGFEGSPPDNPSAHPLPPPGTNPFFSLASLAPALRSLPRFCRRRSLGGGSLFSSLRSLRSHVLVAEDSEACEEQVVGQGVVHMQVRAQSVSAADHIARGLRDGRIGLFHHVVRDAISSFHEVTSRRAQDRLQALEHFGREHLRSSRVSDGVLGLARHKCVIREVLSRPVRACGCLCQVVGRGAARGGGDGGVDFSHIRQELGVKGRDNTLSSWGMG
jgi:hypothetical protein